MQGGAGGAAALCSTPVSQRAPSEREPGLPSQGEAGLQPQPPRLARRAHPQTLRGWRVVHRRTASLAGDRAVTQGQPSEGLCVPPVTTAAGSEWQGRTRSRALPSPWTDGGPPAGKGNWCEYHLLCGPPGGGCGGAPCQAHKTQGHSPRGRPHADHPGQVLPPGASDWVTCRCRGRREEILGFGAFRISEFESATWVCIAVGTAASPGSWPPQGDPVSLRPPPRAPTGQLRFLPACPTKNRPASANDSPAVLLEPQLAHL